MTQDKLAEAVRIVREEMEGEAGWVLRDALETVLAALAEALKGHNPDCDDALRVAQERADDAEAALAEARRLRGDQEAELVKALAAYEIQVQSLEAALAEAQGRRRAALITIDALAEEAGVVLPTADEEPYPCNRLAKLVRGVTAKLAEAKAREVNLREAAEQAQCSCSIAERESGHLVDCWMPSLREAIAALAPARPEPHRFVVPWDEQQGYKPHEDGDVPCGRCGVLYSEHDAPAQPEAPKPRVVCLCGSTRFKEAFDEANYQETMAGRIVLSVGFYMHATGNRHGEGVGATPGQKVALDVLHKRKIDLADEVLVLNVGGYVGESTRSEIDYAQSHGKPIRWLEAQPDAARSEEEQP